MGIFASGILVLSVSIIEYFSVKAKIKAKMHYKLKQAGHLAEQFKLFLKLNKSDDSKQKEIIVAAYQCSYSLNEIFIELSLDETALINYGKDAFANINSMKKVVEAIGKSIAENGNSAGIDATITDMDSMLKSLSSFLDNADLLS